MAEKTLEAVNCSWIKETFILDQPSKPKVWLLIKFA